MLEAALLFKFESIHRVFINKALFISKWNATQSAFWVCLFICLSASLDINHPLSPSRLTLRLNCLHTSCSLFSHLPPQMRLLHCQKSCRLDPQRRRRTSQLILDRFPYFFQLFNSTFNHSLQISWKNVMNLLVVLVGYFTCFSSPPQGLFWEKECDAAERVKCTSIVQSRAVSWNKASS